MWSLLSYDRLDSTNEEAKRLIRAGRFSVEELGRGIVIIANEQSGGKGRNGRQWYSVATDGLYYTLLLKPHAFSFQEIAKHTLLVATHVCVALKNAYGVEAQVEWPNDIILADKKLGGILIETISYGNEASPAALIIGIGINFYHARFPDFLRFAATSLYLETGVQYDKQVFIPLVTEELVHVFTRDQGRHHG